MSRSDWEQGALLIPSAAWSDLKKTVREAHNKHQAARFELARQVHAKLLAAGKGKRGFDYCAALDAVVEQCVPAKPAYGGGYFSGYGGAPERDYARYGAHEAYELHDAIEQALFQRATNGTRAAPPAAPKKKDFVLATNKTRRFHCGDGSIGFSEDAKRTVSWSVGENNHACEHARAHPLAVVFFDALHKIVWTRGTGGEIAGNDENNQDDREPGGGANYTTARYGPRGGRPAGKSEAQIAREAERAVSRSYGGYGYRGGGYGYRGW